MALIAGQNGVCPHCGISVRFEYVEVYGHPSLRFELKNPAGKATIISPCSCPNCGENTLGIVKHRSFGAIVPDFVTDYTMIWPIAGARRVPAEVRQESSSIANDFEEASMIIGFSQKASAALSRRCLQHMLIDKAGVKASDNLFKQIDDVIGQLPSSLADNIDAVRVIGNFSAHPIKSERTGEIVQVEEGEAEWLLDVLEDLFDYYYVAPARAKARRNAINTKLDEAGKPPLKKP